MLMKKLMYLMICILMLLTGCVDNDKKEKEPIAPVKNTTNIISYVSKTPLTEEVLKDVTDAHSVFEYHLDESYKTATIEVWEKNDGWKKIVSTTDPVTSQGEIAIVPSQDSYHIYMIASRDEYNITEYKCSDYFHKSMNHNKIQRANPLEEKEIKSGKEIALWKVLGYKEENNNPKASDFNDVDCDYGLKITITFNNKDIDKN